MISFTRKDGRYQVRKAGDRKKIRNRSTALEQNSHGRGESTGKEDELYQSMIEDVELDMEDLPKDVVQNIEMENARRKAARGRQNKSNGPHDLGVTPEEAPITSSNYSVPEGETEE